MNQINPIHFNGIEDPCGIWDQILLPVGMLLSEICGLVSVGRPLWREVGSVSFQSLSAVIVHRQVLRWGEVRLLYNWQSVSMSWYRAPLWDLRPSITSCRNVAVGRPLWREDGSAICSVNARWSESRRTRNHILLSHLRLPKPGEPDCHIPQELGGPGH
jgi:hypothetical protein